MEIIDNINRLLGEDLKRTISVHHLDWSREMLLAHLDATPVQ